MLLVEQLLLITTELRKRLEEIVLIRIHVTTFGAAYWIGSWEVDSNDTVSKFVSDKFILAQILDASNDS